MDAVRTDAPILDRRGGQVDLVDLQLAALDVEAGAGANSHSALPADRMYSVTVGSARLLALGFRAEQDRLQRHTGLRESIIGEDAAVGEEREIVDLPDFVADRSEARCRSRSSSFSRSSRSRSGGFFCLRRLPAFLLSATRFSIEAISVSTSGILRRRGGEPIFLAAVREVMEVRENPCRQLGEELDEVLE